LAGFILVVAAQPVSFQRKFEISAFFTENFGGFAKNTPAMNNVNVHPKSRAVVM
jgi:hypothetical protein